MKILSTLFLILAVGLGIILLMPIIGVGLALSVPVFCFFIWILPILIIVGSDRTNGGEKAAWILAIIFLSWFAWIFYFLLAPISARPRHREYRSRHRRHNRYSDDYDYRY